MSNFLLNFFWPPWPPCPMNWNWRPYKALQGGDLTVEVVPNTTIRELKAMLHEKKHCEDPIEHKILKVKVLADGLLVDDDQTLESVGMLHAESEATVIYSRNEVDAAAKEAIHVKGFLQVNIPFSLTAIPARAFSECHQVVKAAIPESVKAIGERAFEGCLSLASITIPESVTHIGFYAFRNCESLERITIPESVTAIGTGAFAGCKSLERITIPESVTAIGTGAFADCESLASITIPESVTDVGNYAFAGCESLASITIPKSVTAIGTGAFAGCKSLASITIPKSVTAIGTGAFAGCKSLASITIPESVTAIGDLAFADCKSLASITIPESSMFNGRFAFHKLQVKRRKVWIALFVASAGTSFSRCFTGLPWAFVRVQSDPFVNHLEVSVNQKNDETDMTEKLERRPLRIPKDPPMEGLGNMYSRGPGSQNSHFWGVRILRG